MSSQRAPAQRPYRDIVAGLLIIAASSWMWVVSAEFPSVPQRYNRVLIAGLVILSLAQVVRGAVRVVLSRREAAGAAGTAETDAAPAGTGPVDVETKVAGAREREVSGWRRWVPTGTVFLLGSVLYVWAVPRLGYLTSTAVFLAVGLSTGLGWKVRTILTAVALSAVMYLILDRVVNATVPNGLLL